MPEPSREEKIEVILDEFKKIVEHLKTCTDPECHVRRVVKS